jgi:hypothetical protein
VERHVLLSYTEGNAIEYLGRRLRPFWQRNGMSEGAMLERAEAERAAWEIEGKTFDANLMRDMERVGGKDYAYLTALAFRQTIAAHKLVADADGQPMLFSKENASNGCIDTVDVTYPSSPFFLLFNPRLLEAQLEPMLRYAALPRWRFPFAPHDLGTFPLANGQVYGGGEATEDNQMPVEESGDLLLMVAALERAEGNWRFAERYFPQLEKWAAYLEAKGMDPENQLSTDDFAGHLAYNTNLSLKAIEALGAFAEIAKYTGHAELARRYEATAKLLSVKWEKMARWRSLSARLRSAGNVEPEIQPGLGLTAGLAPVSTFDCEDRVDLLCQANAGIRFAAGQSQDNYEAGLAVLDSKFERRPEAVRGHSSPYTEVGR